MSWIMGIGYSVKVSGETTRSSTEKVALEPARDVMEELAELLNNLRPHLGEGPESNRAERVQIIVNLLWTGKGSPYFNVYPSRDELPFPPTIDSPENIQPSGPYSRSETASRPTAKTRRPSPSSAKGRRTRSSSA